MYCLVTDNSNGMMSECMYGSVIAQVLAAATTIANKSLSREKMTFHL